MKINNVLFICVILILFSCNQPTELNKYTSDGTDVKIKGITAANSAKYSDLFDNVSLIPLQTTDDCLIGRIDKIFFYENHFYILDQVLGKGVFVFDENGNFIRRIGRIGKGPGEYDVPNDMAIDMFSGRLLIFCNNSKKLIAYDFNGNFIEEVKLKSYIDGFSILNNDLIAVYHDNNSPFDDIKYKLELISKDGNIKKTAFRIDGSTDHSRGGKSFFYQSHDELLVSPGFSNTIYTVGLDACKIKYSIDFGDKSIPNDFFLETPKIDFQKELRSSNYAYLLNYYETQEFLAFNFTYKRMVYTCIYSIKTGKLKFGNIFLNDMFGLVQGGMLVGCADGDIISYFESSNIEAIKKLYSESSTDGKLLKNLLIQDLQNINSSLVGVKVYKEMVENTSFRPQKEEVNMIKSIEPTNNPVLIRYRIKPF